jgi:hypothetical protein
MLNINRISFNIIEAQPMPSPAPTEPNRRSVTLATAEAEGLLGIKDKTIAGRVPAPLVAAAKDRSGLKSDSDLLLYALSKVALEDDFGRKLVARKGTIPRTVTLEV